MRYIIIPQDGLLLHWYDYLLGALRLAKSHQRIYEVNGPRTSFTITPQSRVITKL